jgi:hypothetical protein
MTWVITAVVVSGVAQAGMQVRAGQQQKVELDRQAEDAKFQASTEELARREQLNKVLASNAVSLAGGNVAMEGTPSSISLASAKNISHSESVTNLTSKLAQAQTKRAGKNALSTAKMAGASTLLSTGVKAAQLSQPKD